MINDEPQLLHFLDEQKIPYERVEHPPVYTCEQAEQYRPEMQGESTKNLFLSDKKGRFYLVMTACEKKMDLKGLGRALGTSKLHFGSPEKLLEMLGVTPGAVTVLGLVNDAAHQVELVVDAEIWEAACFLCHPLVNTATLVLSKPDLERFFQLSGHTACVVDMPG